MHPRTSLTYCLRYKVQTWLQDLFPSAHFCVHQEGLEDTILVHHLPRGDHIHPTEMEVVEGHPEALLTTWQVQFQDPHLHLEIYLILCKWRQLCQVSCSMFYDYSTQCNIYQVILIMGSMTYMFLRYFSATGSSGSSGGGTSNHHNIQSRPWGMITVPLQVNLHDNPCTLLCHFVV